MKLKEIIPEYKVGDVVTILDNLEDRDINNFNQNDAGFDDNMGKYRGGTHIITNNSFEFWLLAGIPNYVFSDNMFKESYNFEEVVPVVPVAVGLGHNLLNNIQNFNIHFGNGIEENIVLKDTTSHTITPSNNNFISKTT